MKSIWLKCCLALALLGLVAMTRADTPADSLYQLNMNVLTQDGKQAGLDLYRGHPLIISMFYGTCPATCPLLITAIQGYEKTLDDKSLAGLRVLMVSFDPKRDKPKLLADIARQHRVDTQRWMFSVAGEQDARKLAALLGIQYRQLPDGDFQHTARITLVDADGRILAGTSRMFGDTEFAAALKRATATTP